MSQKLVENSAMPDPCMAPQGMLCELESTLEWLFSTSGYNSSTMQGIEARISTIIRDFIDDARVNSEIELADLAERFRQSAIPREPYHFNDYLGYLVTHIVAHSVRTSSPRFIGHMTSALPFFMPPLSNLLTALNQNMVKIETAKSLSFCERQALAMIHRLIYDFSSEFYSEHIQDSESTLGMLVSGGTIANITALWCARNHAFAPVEGFAGVEKEGLAAALDFYGYKGAVVIGSSLMHYSFEKAAGILGIGTTGLVRVPVDYRNRIDLKELRKVIKDCRKRNLYILAIVGIAGTTDCGSIDPLVELAEIAREANAHFHVDAAWGGPLLFSEQHRHRIAGIELADSVTIDGHKQMYLPMGIGLVILRDARLAKTIEKQARYIVRAGSYDLGRRSLEGSRPALVLFLHAALHLIGRKGYGYLLDEGIRKARYFADRVRARQEFELLSDADMNILCYRFLPEPYRRKAVVGQLTESDNGRISQFNKQLQRIQRRAGKTFVSRTTLDTSALGSKTPIVALRVVIANPLTTEADLDAVLDDQVNIAAEILWS